MAGSKASSASKTSGASKTSKTGRQAASASKASSARKNTKRKLPKINEGDEIVMEGHARKSDGQGGYEYGWAYSGGTEGKSKWIVGG